MLQYEIMPNKVENFDIYKAIFMGKVWQKKFLFMKNPLLLFTKGILLIYSIPLVNNINLSFLILFYPILNSSLVIYFIKQERQSICSLLESKEVHCNEDKTYSLAVSH